MNMEHPNTPACPLTQFILLIPQQSGRRTIFLSAGGATVPLMSLVIGVTTSGAFVRISITWTQLQMAVGGRWGLR